MAGLIMLFALLSRFFGFLRELLISYYFGTTLFADMFYIVSSIPLVFYTGYSIAFSNAFIPNYHKSNEKKTIFLNSMVLMFALSLIVSISMIIFPLQILSTMAPGIPLSDILNYKIAVRIVALQIFFIGFNGVINALFNAEEKYFLPSLMNMIFSFSVVIVIFILNNSPINQIFIGITIIYIIQFFSQLVIAFPLLKERLSGSAKLSFSIAWNQFKDSLIIFSSISLSQINYFVDRALASTLFIGALSSVNYVHKLNGFLIGIFGLIISNLIYPYISRSVNVKMTKPNSIDKFVYGLLLVVIPTMIVLSLQSENIVKFLFGYGEFNPSDLKNVSSAFSIIILGTGLYVLKDLYNYILFAFSKHRLVLLTSLLSVGTNVALNFLLINSYKINGLMLATLASYFVAALVNLIVIGKENIELINVRRHVFLFIVMLFIITFILLRG
jgi:putative peptidoglycan lipid II flippase